MIEKLSTDELLESLDNMHEDVDHTLSASRKTLLSATTLRRMSFPTSLPLETTLLSLVLMDPSEIFPPTGLDLADSPASCHTSLSKLHTCLPARLLLCTYAASSRTPTLLLQLQRR